MFAGYRRGAANRENGAPTVQVAAGSVDEPGIAELLALAVGSGDERLEQTVRRYRDESTARLLVAHTEHHPIAVLGYELADVDVVVRHIATAPGVRRTGVATSLLQALRRLIPAGLSIVAETDAHAVGFYRSNGFSVASLGEKYPGVERFQATLPP